MNLFEKFREHRLSHPEETAFMSAMGDRFLPISWKTFTDDIALVAEVIRVHARGKVVALLGENSYEWIVAHAACIFAGAIVVPIDINLSPEDIVFRLKKVKAAVLVYSSQFRHKAVAVKSLFGEINIARFSNIQTDSFLNLASQRLLAGNASIWDEPIDPKNSERVSMYVFTSGTTSSPRAVMHSVSALEAFCEAASPRLQLKRSMRSLMMLPLQHIFGICTTYLMLAEGVHIGICPDFRRLYSDVERFRVNFVFLVPALAEILAKKISQHGVEELSANKLDFVLTGGAHLPRRTYEALTSLGIKVITAYGLTETCSMYSMDFRDGQVAPGSAGVSFADSQTQTKASAEGELLIKGPSVFKGYFEDEVSTQKVFTDDGWFKTGDLGKIDASNNVWITGRISRMIIFDTGKKVSPEEVESKITALPGIEEALVYSTGDDRVITAQIYSKLSKEAVEKLIFKLNRRLPVYMRIRELIIRDTPLPRTTSGKIKVQR
jgi:long-chain acyl-CoA synthetase